MNQNIKSIQSFAKKLIKVASSASIEEVYNIMISEEISYVPIIDNNGKRNRALYSRKKLFEWLIKNPEKDIKTIPKEEFQQEKLPEIEMQTPLQDTMRKLKGKSAILVKVNGEYTHLITPRIVANALEAYSKGFMVFESLEKLIRKKIYENNIDLKEIIDSESGEPLKSDPDRLGFGQYSQIFSKKQTEMGLGHVNKKIFNGLLETALDYRNGLMHFRLKDENNGLEDAKKLINLLR